MTEISALFWDNGGVILTNGWDRNSRRAAVEKFHLEWSDFEDRHELMLNAFETGRATLDEYLRRTIFYRERSFTPEDFKQFMYAQSQPFPQSLEFLGTLVQPRSYLMASLNNESLEINEYRIHKFNLRQYFQTFFSSCYLGRAQTGRADLSLGAENFATRTARVCVHRRSRPESGTRARNGNAHHSISKSCPVAPGTRAAGNQPRR